MQTFFEGLGFLLVLYGGYKVYTFYKARKR